MPKKEATKYAHGRAPGSVAHYLKPGTRGPQSVEHRAKISLQRSKQEQQKRADTELAAVKDMVRKSPSVAERVLRAVAEAEAAALQSPAAAARVEQAIQYAQAEAWKDAYAEATARMQAAEPEAAQRLIETIRHGKASDALVAARELFNRTRGLPTATVNIRKPAETKELSLADVDEELAALRARAAAAEDIEPLPSGSDDDIFS